MTTGKKLFPAIHPNDVARIAAMAIVSPATVRRVFDGQGNAYSRRRVREACARLQLAAPEETHDPAEPSDE